MPPLTNEGSLDDSDAQAVFAALESMAMEPTLNAMLSQLAPSATRLPYVLRELMSLEGMHPDYFYRLSPGQQKRIEELGASVGLSLTTVVWGSRGGTRGLGLRPPIVTGSD